jgi:hypothetical protein
MWLDCSSKLIRHNLCKLPFRTEDGILQAKVAPGWLGNCANPQTLVAMAFVNDLQKGRFGKTTPPRPVVGAKKSKILTLNVISIIMYIYIL